MSQININDLPPEMLTKIFRLLDAETLKNATLACKLWNNLIESGCRWSVSLNYHKGRLRVQKMRSVSLDYGEDRQCYSPRDQARDVQKTNFMLTTKRRFGKIEIYCVRLSKDNEIFEIFRRQGFNIVKLHMLGCYINSPVAFARLLKLTPNLEKLTMEMLEIDNATDVPPDPVLPELKKLKILHMAQSAIIECFRNAKLTTMRIDEEEDTETEPLVDFLSSQTALTSLTITNYKASLSPLSIMAQMGKLHVQIPFRLAKLGKISLGHLHSSQDRDNLLRFVESQAESLTEVELGWNLPISVYECVFERMTKLRTLIVSLHRLPKIPGIYDRLKENGSVCTVILLTAGKDYPLLFEIFKRLPNIRSVIIPKYSGAKEDKLAVMAQHLGRLESLSMRYVGSIGYVKFGNLRTLHIGFLRGNINWNEFTKANPQLVEFIIENIVTLGNGPLLTSDDIDQITTNVELQYLRLGDGFVADDRFFEIIREKCTNLKVLELHTSCVPHELRHNVEINVLRLCEKIDCPTWKFR